MRNEQVRKPVRGHGPLRRIRVNPSTLQVEITPIEERTFLVEQTTIAVETFRVRAKTPSNAVLLVEHRAQDGVYAHDYPVTISRTGKVIGSVNPIEEQAPPESAART